MLVNCMYLVNVCEFDLCGVCLCAVGVKVFFVLLNFGIIMCLWFVGCSLDVVSVDEFVGVVLFGLLEFFDFEYNWFKDEGIEMLVNGFDFLNMCGLILMYNKVCIRVVDVFFFVDVFVFEMFVLVNNVIGNNGVE